MFSHGICDSWILSTSDLDKKKSFLNKIWALQTHCDGQSLADSKVVAPPTRYVQKILRVKTLNNDHDSFRMENNGYYFSHHELLGTLKAFKIVTR